MNCTPSIINKWQRSDLCHFQDMYQKLLVEGNSDLLVRVA